MKSSFAAAMRRATLATRAGDLGEAMRTIQSALRGADVPVTSRVADGDPAPPPVPTLRLVGATAAAATKPDEPTLRVKPRPSFDRGRWHRVRRPLREVLAAVRQGRVTIDHAALRGLNLPGIDLPGAARSTPPPVPAGAQFVWRSFAGPAGERSYKLYIPASAADRPRGLVVMLHGCNQNPDDFACGTNMNAVAEANGMLVAYPAQPMSANASSCWNWFNPADQRRGAGEPAILAGITRDIAAEFHLERQQVFVAGLSAGGAMAAIMAETYPDVYSAVGIHSGLAYRSADDVVSAFAAMRGDAGDPVPPDPRPSGKSLRVRTIVFQGSGDAVVHPANADQIVMAATPTGPGFTRREECLRDANGRAATRTVVADENGAAVVEYWVVQGAGHAWSGGKPTGSYADVQGPDASAAMVRFFVDQPRPTAAD